MSLNEAIDKAIMKMPEYFSIKEIIVKHQMEVKGILFSEAETEFEMNKLKNYYIRIASEEARKEERERINLFLTEKGVDKAIIDAIDTSSITNEQLTK